MTHQVALPPEQEQKLTQQAQLRGMNTEDYLQFIVSFFLESESPWGKTGASAADEWLDSLAVDQADLPVLRPDALTRESLYADHD